MAYSKFCRSPDNMCFNLDYLDTNILKIDNIFCKEASSFTCRKLNSKECYTADSYICISINKDVCID